MSVGGKTGFGVGGALLVGLLVWSKALRLCKRMMLMIVNLYTRQQILALQGCQEHEEDEQDTKAKHSQNTGLFSHWQIERPNL